MADQTTNYKMIKPIGSEKYNLDVFNDNWDTIDAQMKINADEVAKKENEVKGAASTMVKSNTTASRVIVSDTSGKLTPSDITTTELGYLDGAKKNIQEQIDAETKARSDSDVALGGRIDSEASARSTNDTALGKRIDDETSDRKSEITRVEGLVSSEATARSQGDSTLDGKITAEANTRTTNDTALGKRIDAEITAREQGDSTLDGKITSEANTRKADDDTLRSRIATEEQERAKAVNAEITARQNADVNLQNQVNGKVPQSGGTMTGKLIAQNNTEYTTAQVRNIIVSTMEPTSADGSNGMLWLVYKG